MGDHALRHVEHVGQFGGVVSLDALGFPAGGLMGEVGGVVVGRAQRRHPRKHIDRRVGRVRGVVGVNAEHERHIVLVAGFEGDPFGVGQIVVVHVGVGHQGRGGGHHVLPAFLAHFRERGGTEIGLQLAADGFGGYQAAGIRNQGATLADGPVEQARGFR